MDWPPSAVSAVCDDWLAAVDALRPGLVTGLFLRGGLAFGEYVEGRSDIDFVATLSRRADAADLAALEDAHLSVAHHGIAFDGMHVLASDLASDPELCPDVPCTLHGLFEAEARYDLSLVAWHELDSGAVVVRGELPPIHTDADGLERFTRDNLDTYWREQAEALAAFPAEAARESACEWCVLGVARLHHLLVTGQQTTKSGAAHWGLAYYGEGWHRVLREALRIRESEAGEYADPAERGADTAAFTAYVVEAGTSGR